MDYKFVEGDRVEIARGTEALGRTGTVVRCFLYSADGDAAYAVRMDHDGEDWEIAERVLEPLLHEDGPEQGVRP